jgi:hypothetical protein
MLSPKYPSLLTTAQAHIVDVVRATQPRLSARFSTMAIRSRSQIIQSKPIGDGLNGFRDSFNSICKELGISNSLKALDQMGNEGNAHRACYHALLTPF